MRLRDMYEPDKEVFVRKKHSRKTVFKGTTLEKTLKISASAKGASEKFLMYSLESSEEEGGLASEKGRRVGDFFT